MAKSKSGEGSEHTLWDRVRSAIGHRGHFSRLEFNPEAGIPDVDYCIRGIEGKLELKFRRDAPARIDTAVFTSGGLRDGQVIWINQRVRHGGRAFILAQVDGIIYLVPGIHARTFNAMTLHQIAKASSWSAGPQIAPAEWLDLIGALRSVLPPL